MAKVTHRDIIVTELTNSFPVALSDGQIADNTGIPEPSVRRTRRELVTQGRVRTVDFYGGPGYPATYVMVGQNQRVNAEQTELAEYF